MVEIKLPDGARQIIKRLEENGFEAYIVGGCVRDSLLGLTPKDWDICTAALPEETKACFPEYHIIETGIKHGTVTVVVKGEPFEVTTYRIDGAYSDCRHPDGVRFVRKLKDDLARRDFRINAMAYRPSDGLKDFFHGAEDLQRREIACVGEPDERFQEDALRILRALRFASVYGFQIERRTGESMRRKRGLIQKLAVERIQAELVKLLPSPGAGAVLEDFSEIFFTFIPELAPLNGFEQHNPHHHLTVWEHTVKAVSAAGGDLLISITMLFHDIAKPLCFSKDENGIGHFYGHPQKSAEMTGQILKRLRFDTATIQEVTKLVLEHDMVLQPRRKLIRRALNRLGEPSLKRLIKVKRADIESQAPQYQAERLAVLDESAQLIDEIIAQGDCFRLSDLAVNGRDLMAQGVPEGVMVGRVLNRLMEQVLSETLPNNRKDLLEEVSRCIGADKGANGHLFTGEALREQNQGEAVL